MNERQDAPAPEILHVLQPGEELTIYARPRGTVIAVTDRRVILTDNDRVVFDLPFEGIRRLQFDLERGRPGTFSIVPESLAAEPQVLSVPLEEYEHMAAVAVRIGQRLG